MTEQPAARPRAATVAVIALCVSSALVVSLSTATWPGVDPVTEVISDYAYHGWAAPAFIAAVLLLAAGGVAAVASMPHRRATRVLVAVWAAAAVGCAVFRTNPEVGEHLLTGEIHRAAGAVLLTAMPVAAWLLAPASAKASTLRSLAALTLAMAAVFAISQVGPIALERLQGLLERAALGAEVALLLVVATVAPTTRSTHPQPVAETTGTSR